MEKAERNRKIFQLVLPIFLVFGIYRGTNDNYHLLFFTVAVGVCYLGRDWIIATQWYVKANESFKNGDSKIFPLIQLLLFFVLIALSLLIGAVAVKSLSLLT